MAHKKGQGSSRNGRDSNPQYLGVILFTSSLTAASWYIVSTTFGAGFISREATVLVWLIMVVGYLGLAFAEEFFLTENLGDEYNEYKNKTAFIFPFVNSSKKIFIIIATLAISVVLLWLQIYDLMYV